MNTDRPDKYVVIKSSDLDDLYHKFRMNPDALEALNSVQINAVPDATVIRAQDVFAGPGLEAYAGVVQTAIELVEGSGMRSLWGIQIPALRALADLFHERAAEAAAVTLKKVPD